VLTDVAAPPGSATARTRLPYETAGSSVIRSVHQYLTQFPISLHAGPAGPPGYDLPALRTGGRP
jgi:hypothetical protein